jgi:hypothetical protein
VLVGRWAWVGLASWLRASAARGSKRFMRTKNRLNKNAGYKGPAGARLARYP